MKCVLGRKSAWRAYFGKAIVQGVAIGLFAMAWYAVPSKCF